MRELKHNYAVQILKGVMSDKKITRLVTGFNLWRVVLTDAKVMKRFNQMAQRSQAAGVAILQSVARGMIQGQRGLDQIKQWVMNVLTSAEATSKRENRLMHRRKQDMWKAMELEKEKNDGQSIDYALKIKETNALLAEKISEMQALNAQLEEFKIHEQAGLAVNERTAVEGGIILLLEREHGGRDGTIGHDAVGPGEIRSTQQKLEMKKRIPHSRFGPVTTIPWATKMDPHAGNDGVAYRTQEKRVQVIIYPNDAGERNPEGVMMSVIKLGEILELASSKKIVRGAKRIFTMKGEEVKVKKPID